MDNVKKTKHTQWVTLLLVAFVFVRAVVLAQRTSLGLKMMNFSLEILLFWVTLFVFAVLIAVVIMKVQNGFGEIVSYLCVIIIADPIFCMMQNNSVDLFVISLGLLCVLNMLREKPLIKNEILFLLFVFVSVFLLPYSVFNYIPVAFLIYIIPGIYDNQKNKSKVLTVILALVFVITGVLLHNYFFANFIDFQSFLNKISFFEIVKTIKSPEILILSVPTLALGIYFFIKVLKSGNLIETKKSDKSKKKPSVKNKSTSKFKVYEHVLITVLCASAYLLSVVGLFLYGGKVFYTVNFIVPITLMLMVMNKDSKAINVIESINEKLRKHPFVSLILLILFYCLSIKIMDLYYSRDTLISESIFNIL